MPAPSAHVTCARKRTFRTRAEAEAAAAETVRNLVLRFPDSPRLEPYLCPVAGRHWHLGHQKQEARR